MTIRRSFHSVTTLSILTITGNIHNLRVSIFTIRISTHIFTITEYAEGIHNLAQGISISQLTTAMLQSA